MRRAVLAMVLLLAAAPAFSAPSRKDLDLRARLLLREIREQASASKKDTSRLRSELAALKAENNAAPDETVAARLRLAEADLALVDAGSPLPPPTADETVADGDLPDRDAVAQPAMPVRAPIYQNAGPASLPESGGPVFDGTGRRSSLGSPSVGVPPSVPSEDLDKFLTLNDYVSRMEFLVRVSSGLIEKMGESDPYGGRSEHLAMQLHIAIHNHPERENFISLRVRVTKDGMIHLTYRLREGGAVDEVLGSYAEWSKAVSRGKGGGKRRGKKSGGAKAGGGGDDGDSPKSGHKGHGKKKHGGGGAGGGDGGGDGGGGDGDGGGTGAGRGGSGRSHHAKVPHVKGGDGMFDGGDSSGEAALPGGSGAHGRGARGRGRKGHGAGPSAGVGDGGGAVAKGSRSGGGRVRAGRSIAADDDSAGSGPGSHKKRGTKVPLPKDFTSRGGSSKLDAEGGGRGGKGEGGEGGGRMGRLGGKKIAQEVPPPAAVAQSARASGAPAQAKPGASAPSAPGAASGAPALNAPFTVDGDLRDAVAGSAAVSPRLAIPLASASRTPAPAAPAAPSDPLPLAAACAGLAGLGLGVYAFRRSRQP